MTFKLNAAARIQQTRQLVQAAPDGLYSKLVKVLGKEDAKRGQKNSPRQTCSWTFDRARGRNVGLEMTFDTKANKVSLNYTGFTGNVDVDGDEGKVLAVFKKKAQQWLESGDATPEDREHLEKILTAK